MVKKNAYKKNYFSILCISLQMSDVYNFQRRKMFLLLNNY